jgi:5-formyltetrahydrofolate cyclo-ligase
MGNEVPTRELIRELLKTGKVVAVPDWEGWKNGSGIRLAAIRGEEEIVTGGRAVPQPVVTSSNIVPTQDVGLFIVPGLAFDGSGNRLGMGGGYFDRLLALASSEAVFFGLAYGFQLVDHLPWETHDIPVHRVFTPGSEQSVGRIDK